MTHPAVPPISESEIADGLRRASESPRKRVPRILHDPGAYFNEVFNFMKADTYMQPHLHPGDEKIEKIYLVHGRCAVFYFDDQGTIVQTTILEEGGTEMIEVPAFTWHTYVMLSDSVVTYETMNGTYEPETWKDFSGWAPEEGTSDAEAYRDRLKASVKE